jgi:hypothetical protein
MAPTKELKAGDACPTCGGDFAVDPRQAPDTLIARKTKNTMNPASTARFAVAVQEKAEAFGLIHQCTACGYRARFAVKKAKAAA